MTLRRPTIPLSLRTIVGTAAAALTLLAGRASAQLRQDQVLVVYDSRIADSLAVAEHYAGSLKVPGGTGAVRGAHPGVRTLDLASTGQPATGVPEIDYATFTARLRDPIRAHLLASDPTDIVRSIVLTKGLPHRILDQTNPMIGDIINPPPPPFANGEQWLVTELLAGDVTYASVDSELTLLWQDLNDGSGGQSQGSRAAGMILNPFWRSDTPIDRAQRPGLHSQKSLDALYTETATGILWRSQTGASALTPGDVYLVCRLDATTVADVRGMIDRAQIGYLDMTGSVVILDESRSNGVADATPINSSEIDNQDLGDTLPECYLWGGDDYEQSRDQLTSDGRWPASRVLYDALGGTANYYRGPGGAPAFGTEGILVTDPVAYLATEGRNAEGPLPGGNAASLYLPFTFNWAPMAVYTTLESFNGRAFGGLTGRFNQSSVSESFHYGVCFGIGYVWEPFAPALADNTQILKHFHLGGMCWAEAAYSSLPALSWQTVVLGDPLARVQRSSEDIDGNQRVNIDDAYAWELNRTDINNSGSANAADRAILHASLRAAEFQDLRGDQRP